MDRYRKDKYPSTPVSNVNFKKKDKISFKLSKGDVLCFSGHHLHGSIQSKVDRLNLETRLVKLGYSLPPIVRFDSFEIYSKNASDIYKLACAGKLIDHIK